MIDPLSILGAITGLIGVGATIYEHLSDLKEASSAVGKVREEISRLGQVLISLKKLVHEESWSISWIPSNVLVALSGILNDLRVVQFQILHALKPYIKLREDHWLSAIVREMTRVWVRERDLEKLRKSLETHQASLTVTMSIVHLFGTRTVIQSQEEVKSSVSDILGEIKKLRCLLEQNGGLSTHDSTAAHHFNSLERLYMSDGYSRESFANLQRRQTAPPSYDELQTNSGKIQNQPTSIPSWQDAVDTFGTSSAPPPGFAMDHLVPPTRRWTTQTVNTEVWARTQEQNAPWSHSNSLELDFDTHSSGWYPPINLPQHNSAPVGYEWTNTPPRDLQLHPWTVYPDSESAHNSFIPHHEGTSASVISGGHGNHEGMHQGFPPPAGSYEWTHYPVTPSEYNAYPHNSIPRTFEASETPPRTTNYPPWHEQPPQHDTRSTNSGDTPAYSPPPQFWEPDPEPEKERWTSVSPEIPQTSWVQGGLPHHSTSY